MGMHRSGLQILNKIFPYNSDGVENKKKNIKRKEERERGRGRGPVSVWKECGLNIQQH